VRARNISVVFLLLVIVHSYGQQKGGWKGKIEHQDGVKVIVNPKEPLHGEIELIQGFFGGF